MPLTQLLAEYVKYEGKQLDVSGFANKVQFMCYTKLYDMVQEKDHWVVTPIAPNEAVKAVQKTINKSKKRGGFNMYSEAKPPKKKSTQAYHPVLPSRCCTKITGAGAKN